MKRYLLLMAATLLLPVVMFAQGTTSGTIEGKVTDTSGEPLPGANVIAIHKPTGTRYGTATRANGQFTFKSVHVGGPYEIQVTFVGFNAQKKQVANVNLGETVEVNFSLKEGQLSLGEISVTAQVSHVFNTNRTGAKTNISEQEINTTPQLSRSLQSYTSLTPHSTGGSSFGGANNNYNNILVDGATLNDVFGLSGSGTPGGQAGVASPISIDAIKEFNVDVAPFDVTNNNFNGAQVNAITKSGTNEFHGTAYFQLRNQSLEGRYELIRGNGLISQKTNDFDQKFYGLSVGGPVIKNKLFFFLNGELKREAAPVGGGVQGSGVDNPFPEPASFFQDVKNEFQNNSLYGGYNPGTIDQLSQSTDNNKLLAKLDWNINDQNKFTLRYNHVDATDGKGISRGQYSYSYSKNGYDFVSKQNSFVAELNSSFGSNTSNTLRAVYTRIRDSRDPISEPYPSVTISLYGLQGGSNTYAVNAGVERFSQQNALGQDLYELTDNFTYIYGNHELTFGTSNHYFHFNNLFVQDAYGTYTYWSMQDFQNGKPHEYQYSYLKPGGKPRAKFSALQVGGYVQDKWSATDRFTLTAGLRIDIPFAIDKPSYNGQAEQSFGYNTTNVASGNILWSPRVGFNWDLSKGDLSTQLRGGIGIFSGPPPFVWLSNQYSNTGVDYGRVDYFGAGNGFFSPDPYNQPSPLDPNSSIQGQSTTEVDLISNNFKYPQSMKYDLALDKELPGGITATIEGIFTDDINAIKYKNLNLVQTGTTMYGRPLYGSVEYNSYYHDAVRGYNSPLVDGQNFTDAILLTNTNKGYRYSITGELKKQFDAGLSFDVSYTYNRARSINSGTSSRAISNWTYNASKDPNNPRLGTSEFELRHRILAKAAYQFNYGRGMATTISLIYDGHSGDPFSWVYNGNANADRGDGRYLNDLVYVPNNLVSGNAGHASDVIVASHNADVLDAFINDHPSLDNYRGEVVPRNTAKSPWSNMFNLRVNQKIQTVEGQSVEITASLFNVLNFLNRSWGKQRYIPYDASIWTIDQYVDQDYINNNYDHISNLGPEDMGKPVIYFDPSNGYDSNLYQTDNIRSRWRLQFGIRYNF